MSAMGLRRYLQTLCLASLAICFGLSVVGAVLLGGPTGFRLDWLARSGLFVFGVFVIAVTLIRPDEEK